VLRKVNHFHEIVGRKIRAHVLTNRRREALFQRRAIFGACRVGQRRLQRTINRAPDAGFEFDVRGAFKGGIGGYTRVGFPAFAMLIEGPLSVLALWCWSKVPP
jgi:hypothetical protein